MRKLSLLVLFSLVVPVLTWAQGLNDPALQAAIDAANAADPNLGRPLRWEFEILLPTTDSALSCPLVPGVQLADASTPYVVTLYYGGPNGELPYVVHVAQDGSRAQRCDTKFPNMGMSAVSLLPEATAPDPCTVVPSGPFANVRSAPDTEAEQTATIEGARPALGRNTDFTWYLVAEGWVAGTVVTNSGDCLSNNLSIRDATIASGLAPSAQPTPPPAGGPTAVPGIPTATPQADFTCPAGFDGYLPPRIRAGQVTAQVEQGGFPNSIRRLPTTDSDRLGSIQPGRRIDLVIDGPQCSAGFVWWLVEIDGVRGWTAESSFSEGTYFLAPTPGNAVTVDGEEVAPLPPGDATAPAPPRPITFAEVGDLTLAATLNVGAAPLLGGLRADDTLVWATGPQVFAVAFPPLAGATPLDQLTGGQFTSVTTEASGDVVYAGDDSGVLHAYRDGAIARVNAHESPVNTLALSPDGALLASGSGSATTDAGTWTLRLWDIAGAQGAQGAPLPAVFARSVRFPYPVTGVAFSGDGAFMAVVGQQTTPEPAAALWVYGDGGRGASVVSLGLDPADAGNAFVTAVPGGSGFLYGRGGLVFELDPATGTEAARLGLANDTEIRDIAVNPTGDNVVAIAGDSVLTLTTLAGLRGASEPGTLPSLAVSAVDVAFSADGARLLVQLADGAVEVYGLP